MVPKKAFSKFDPWDQRIILKYNGLGGEKVTVLLRILSFFGRETIWMLLMVFYLLIFYNPMLFSYISSMFLLGVLIIAPIKKYTNRDRPFETLKEIKILERKPTSRSFPSWHAYNVVSQGLLLAYLLNSWLVAGIILVFAAIVSFSRIQLGVHYPSDVIFGFFIGFVGFILAVPIFAPILLQMILFFERVIGGPVYYEMINPLLYQNLLFLILVIGLILMIILFASYKRLKEIIEKQDN
ncbi:MAG: phosphatase PAP2 family protein [Candidatus Hermodarchaeota archaeon]